MSDKTVDARVDRIVADLQAKRIEIHRADNDHVVQVLERNAGGTCPAFFRSLVSRYTFSELEIGPLRMFANHGADARNDFQVAPFRDPILAQWMKANHLLQIGRAVSRHYDPICLSLRAFDGRSTKDPLVQFDHESILQDEAGVQPVQRWDSWIELVEWSECAEVEHE